MQRLRLDEDHHVHSTFSDGKGTIVDNIAQAERRGLKTLVCVDHVRRDTDWLPGFVAAAKACADGTDVRILVGVEAKILDADGHLDVPTRLDGVDKIYAADHQMPLPGGCRPARPVREMLADGRLSPNGVMELLVRATCRAMCRHPGLVVAHLFSVLPKLGLNERDVPSTLVCELAAAAVATGSSFEVDERWRCPSSRTVRLLLACGAEVVASTDSHRAEDVGRYEFVREVAQAVEGISC